MTSSLKNKIVIIASDDRPTFQIARPIKMYRIRVNQKNHETSEPFPKWLSIDQGEYCWKTVPDSAALFDKLNADDIGSRIMIMSHDSIVFEEVK